MTPGRSSRESRRRAPGAKRKPAPALAIIGAGRAGAAIAVALSRRGWPIAAVAASRVRRARALARLCAAPIATTDLSRASREADAIVLAVPDRILPGLVRTLAASEPRTRRGRPARRFREGASIAIHTSGASGASVLAPLRARGWAVGSFHPLLSFPPPATTGPQVRRGSTLLPSFEGAAIAIDGDLPAQRLARRLAATLRAHPLAIPDADRARYHLSACFAANYVVTLVWEATRLLEEAGVPRRRALPALLPLVRSTVANLGNSGLPDALTGPVARGDDSTLARHAALMRRADPQRRALHRLLVERTARLARASGFIDAAALRRIQRALGR